MRPETSITISTDAGYNDARSCRHLFFVALPCEKDEYHGVAVDTMEDFPRPLVTAHLKSVIPAKAGIQKEHVTPQHPHWIPPVAATDLRGNDARCLIL